MCSFETQLLCRKLLNLFFRNVDQDLKHTTGNFRSLICFPHLEKKWLEKRKQAKYWRINFGLKTSPHNLKVINVTTQEQFNLSLMWWRMKNLSCLLKIGHSLSPMILNEGFRVDILHNEDLINFYQELIKHNMIYDYRIIKDEHTLMTKIRSLKHLQFWRFRSYPIDDV